MNATRVTKVFLIFLASCLVVLPGNGQTADWSLSKDKNGIQIFTRKVEGSPIKEYKAVMEVDHSIEEVSHVIQDIDTFEEWFVDIDKIEMAGDHPDGGIAVYMVIDTPFPVQDRDLVIVMVEEEANDDLIRISTRAEPDFVDKDDDYVRMPSSEGYWILEALDSSKTRVVNTNLSDPGGSIPKWVINMMLTSNPYNTFTNLREYLAERN